MRGASWDPAVAQSQQISAPYSWTKQLIGDIGVMRPVTLLTRLRETIRRGLDIRDTSHTHRDLNCWRRVRSSFWSKLPSFATPIWTKSTSASLQGRRLLWCSKGPTNTIGRFESFETGVTIRPVDELMSVDHELASPSVCVRWWRRRSPESLKLRGQPGKVHCNNYN